MKFLLLVATAVLAAHGAVAQDNCKGTPNMHPVYQEAPEFVSSVKGGSKFTVGPADLDPKLSVIHVYGTSYEMGQAYGELMRTEITTLIPQVYSYIYTQIAPFVKDLPPDVQKAVEKYGTEVALDFTLFATKKFIPQHYLDLVAGMSNATGIAQDDLLKIALFPELIKMSCSMFGAWNEATVNTTSGLVQLRALDWSTNGPFQQFPVVIVYHPTAGEGHTYATLTWAGLVGAVSGMSSAGVGVSEKVWLHYKGKYSPFGYPTTFLLEDILHYDIDTDQALSRIASANRTASIFIGIGDKYNNHFKAVEYSHTTVNVFNDRNFPTYTNHDQFDNLVFVDKHTQPSADPCFNSLLHKYYGSLDPVTTLRYITAQFQTGDMHIAIYDFANNLMFVSNASPYVNGTNVMAYDRPFVQLNMTTLFAQPAPSH